MDFGRKTVYYPEPFSWACLQRLIVPSGMDFLASMKEDSNHKRHEGQQGYWFPRRDFAKLGQEAAGSIYRRQ